MTRTQSKIPFHDLTFHDDLSKLRDVEARLKTFRKTTREEVQRTEIAAGRITDDNRVYGAPHRARSIIPSDLGLCGGSVEDFPQNDLPKSAAR